MDIHAFVSVICELVVNSLDELDRDVLEALAI